MIPRMIQALKSNFKEDIVNSFLDVNLLFEWELSVLGCPRLPLDISVILRILLLQKILYNVFCALQLVIRFLLITVMIVLSVLIFFVVQ